MPHFFELSATVTKFGFCATLIINMIFISLTLSYTRAITGTYRKMLVVFAMTCILFSIVEAIVQPSIHNFNGGLVYFSLNDNPIFSQGFLRMTLVVYSGCLIAQITFIAIQFLFRYFTIIHHPFLKTFKGPKMLIWIFYFLGTGSIYGMLVLLCLESDDYSDEYMNTEMRNVYLRDIKDTPRVLAVAYQNGKVRVGNVIFLLSASAMFGLQYVIIIFCGLTMQNAMQTKLKNLSNRNRKLERQFFKALTVQIILPTFLITIPVGIVLLLPLLDLKVNIQTGLIFVLYSFYPPLDSIATMTIIKEYRYSLKELFKDLRSIRLKERGSQDETSVG